MRQGRQLVQMGRRRIEQTGDMAEGPMRRRNRFVGARQNQPQLLRVVAMRLEPDRGALNAARPAPFRPALALGEEIVERQIPLVARS